MDRRATCLNCMDGRTQLPVIHWIRENQPVDFVDVITEAGMDGVLANQKDISEILRSIKISVDINHSSVIFVAGHHDCRGNPTDKETHQRHVREAVARIRKHWPEHKVIGLWVTEAWRVEVVPDGNA